MSDDELVSDFASSSRAPDDESGFGALSTGRGCLPLESMVVRGRIDGLLARVTVRQTFVNMLDEPLEAAYILPLPDRAAVTRFRMEVAGRVVEGLLEERGQAREHYDQAISAGRRAAIAEEDRPGVFNLRVGNLIPGERATVELTLCGVLPYADGEVTFRFPMVVAPRYIPGMPLPGPSVGEGTAPDTQDVPDASRITPPVLLLGFPNPVRLSLEVEVHDRGAEVDEVRCSLHAVRDEVRDGYRLIRIYPGERLNRDFILRFRLGGPTIQSTLTLHPDTSRGGEGTFALTVVPPATVTGGGSRPRDITFVLDRSGSMEGWKIVAARRALARMIDTLNDADRFCILAFDNTVETPPRLPAGLVPATDRHRFRAVEYLAMVGARGGTEMAEPLDRAVNLLAQNSAEGRDRVLVLITDGQVGNEDQILATLDRQLKGIRVFTLGIDRAVNEGFLRRLAERGGGSCELVESEDRLDEVMSAVHRRIGTPLLTGLSLVAEGLAIEPGEVVPRRLPDLFAGSPLLILGRYRGRPAGALTIHASEATGRAWSESVPAEARDNPAVAAAWARGRVRHLEDRYAAGDGDRTALERALVALSLKFQILCRFTAFVAVDRSQVVTAGGAPHRITQPVEQVEGWGKSFRSASHSALAEAAPAPSLGRVPRNMLYLSIGATYGPAETAGPPPPPSGMAWLTPQFGGSPPEKAPPPPSFWGELRRLHESMFGFHPTRDAGVDKAAVNQPKPQPAAEASPPINLPDRFEIRGKLGAGARSLVFKAYDRQRGQSVVVKMVPTQGRDKQILVRWRRLAEILTALGHPAIIPILDVDHSGRWLWIVLPLVEGRTLADRLMTDRRMAPREAAELVVELAEALQRAHQHGLVHGDINPSNILLGDDRQPRLLGFGETLRESATSQLGATVGTPSYAAPECLSGAAGPPDPRSDVYRLGVLLYQILTGQLPFRGRGLRSLICKILDKPPTPPHRLVRSIPADLEAICLKAMAKDPDQRYATAGELATALRAFLTPARRDRFWK
jgi:Ca-activated chloride channel family protein